MRTHANIITPASNSVGHLKALCEVEEKAWASPGANITANKDKIAARIASFREGVSLALVNEEAAGSQFAFRLDWDGDHDRLTTWDELTCEGWTNRVHDPKGNTGFLVGVGVVPKFRGIKASHNLGFSDRRRISELLILYTLENLFTLGVQRVIACARIPLYHTLPQLTIEQYCSLRREDGYLFDPVLRFHERLGAMLIKPAHCAMEDAESLDGGCWVMYTS